MRNEWQEKDPGCLTWADDGRAIEVFVNEELVRSATLRAENCWFDGEEDVPIWTVVFEEGQRAELGAVRVWRFA